MYEENQSTFKLKGIILKIILILLVTFIIIWLFPTKDYVSNLINQKLGTSEEQVFNNNVNTMKNAALSYYTGSRLPQNNGDKSKLTLKEMLDENLLIEFTDSKGKTCDTKKSYVEITKNEEDYKMKVNLSCSDKEAYIVSYIGLYDYCAGGVCEKKKLTENEESQETLESQEPQTTANECKYAKTSGGYYTNYGNWSSWTTNRVTSSNTREVQTKSEKVQTGVTTVKTGTTTSQSNPKKITYSNGAVVYECSSQYDNAGRYTSPRYCIKTTAKYEQKAVYKMQTYYRYRDRKYVNRNTDYKWDSCDNTELTQKGYTKTGETR